jgi:hypothetical protein
MVDRIQPPADHRIGHHDRLGDGDRNVPIVTAVPQRSPQSSQVHSRSETARRQAGGFHDDAAVGAGDEGQADLRRSWDAMGHRGAEPHGADVPEPADERLPRARVVLARHRGHPVVSAVPRGHAVAVQHERDEGPLRSDGPGDRRRAVDRHRRSGLQTLARTAASGAIAHRFSDPEEHLLSRAELQRVRRRRLHRHFPSLQGRPRAEGQLRQRCGRRQRLALSEAARRRLVGAGSSRDHERAE